MHPNAPRCDSEPLAPSRSGGRGKPVQTGLDGLVADTRERLAGLWGPPPGPKKVEDLLTNGHVALALLWVGGAGIPSHRLRRAAETYESKGWLYLAAEAYRAISDRQSLERLAATLRKDGLTYDAAELLNFGDEAPAPATETELGGS